MLGTHYAEPASTSTTGARASTSIGTFPKRASGPSVSFVRAIPFVPASFPPPLLLRPSARPPSTPAQESQVGYHPPTSIWLTTPPRKRRQPFAHSPQAALAQDIRRTSSWTARRSTYAYYSPGAASCAPGPHGAASALVDRAALGLHTWIFLLLVLRSWVVKRWPGFRD